MRGLVAPGAGPREKESLDLPSRRAGYTLTIRKGEIMCGIFAFTSTGGLGPDLNYLADIAVVTESRGAQAFGFAWLNSDGVMRQYRQSGKLSANLDCLSMLEDAQMMIAHTRFSTHGNPDHNINNHPHPCDGGWIVHNGIIFNAAKLVADHKLRPSSECDSEVIGLLIEKFGRAGGLAGRMGRAINLTMDGPLATMGLWPHRGGQFLWSRRGHPLHRGVVTHGKYYASLPEGLPGKVHALTDNKVVLHRWSRGERRANHEQTYVLRKGGNARQRPLFTADRETDGVSFEFGQAAGHDSQRSNSSVVGSVPRIPAKPLRLVVRRGRWFA